MVAKEPERLCDACPSIGREAYRRGSNSDEESDAYYFSLVSAVKSKLSNIPRSDGSNPILRRISLSICMPGMLLAILMSIGVAVADIPGIAVIDSMVDCVVML